jgi:hypothetical protein
MKADVVAVSSSSPSSVQKSVPLIEGASGVDGAEGGAVSQETVPSAMGVGGGGVQGEAFAQISLRTRRKPPSPLPPPPRRDRTHCWRLGEGEKKEAGVNFLPLLRAPGVVVVVVRAFVGL